MIQLNSARVERETANLRTALVEDHERMEQVFGQLAEALEAGAWDAARRHWAVFERHLQAHLDLEEQEMLPRFARVDAPAAARFASEHAALRNEIADLGNGIDLHETNPTTVAAFHRRLREHAAREEGAMYRWAEQALPESKKRALVERLTSIFRPFSGIRL